MITYTLNQTPVAPRRFDGASEEAKLMAEVFERLIEIEDERFGAAASMVRRLATLADVSPRGFLMVCLLYTSPSPRDYAASRMPSSA